MCVIERSVLVMTQGPNPFGQISIMFLFIFSRFSLRNSYLKNSNSQRIINIITPTVKVGLSAVWCLLKLPLKDNAGSSLCFVIVNVSCGKN